VELEDLNVLIEQSRSSAFRLETLPQYLVPQEAEEFAAWLAGERPPLLSPQESPWLAKVHARAKAGYRRYRVHIVDYPLSDYNRFVIYGFQANAAAGEEIYLADRDAHVELEPLREDFWLIDDACVVRMVYDDEGHFLRPELVTPVQDYRRIRDVALRHATPLHLYPSASASPRLTA